MNKIKAIVEELSIPEQRERVIKNRKRIEIVKQNMYNLTFYPEVSYFVYLSDCLYKRKLEAIKDASYSDMKKLSGELKHLDEEIAVLKGQPLVDAYLVYQEVYDKLVKENSEYYQTINIMFRNKLRKIDVPNIFVYQGMLDKKMGLHLARHIIFPNAQEAYIETPDIIVAPNYLIRSNRDARHFYNKTSFKYLEQLSQDYDFDVKTKKLGIISLK